MNTATATAPAKQASDIQIRALDPVMGAEIIGADLSRPISDAELARYRDALHTYKVLAFRDQELTKEQLLAFSKRWGPLGEHIMPGAASDDYEEINVMSNATAAYINQLLRRHASDCRAAMSRLAGVERLQDVVRASEVIPPSVIASVARCAPERRQLEHVAEQRVLAICQTRLKQLQDLSCGNDAEAFSKARGRFLEDVQCLRGYFPGPLQRVVMEIERVGRKARARYPEPARRVQARSEAGSDLDSAWHQRPRAR